MLVIWCPKCKGYTRVKSGGHRLNAKYWRRHECKECSQEFATGTDAEGNIEYHRWLPGPRKTPRTLDTRWDGPDNPDKWDA